MCGLVQTAKLCCCCSAEEAHISGLDKVFYQRETLIYFFFKFLASNSERSSSTLIFMYFTSQDIKNYWQVPSVQAMVVIDTKCIISHNRLVKEAAL